MIKETTLTNRKADKQSQKASICPVKDLLICVMKMEKNHDASCHLFMNGSS